MNQLLKNIIQARCGGATQRCHTIRHNGSYNNAEHSWGVAMLMFYLYPEDFPKLGIYCLTHDIGEGWVGDIPSPVLGAIPELRAIVDKLEKKVQASLGLPKWDKLSKADLQKINSCDKLELYFWCHEQHLLGNKFAEDCACALEEYFSPITLEEKAYALYQQINNTAMCNFIPVQLNIIKELYECK